MLLASAANGRLRSAPILPERGFPVCRSRPVDFDTDAVFGAKDEDLAFCALAHVAPVGEGAELGLSVLAAARGRGLGGALFEQAVIWARNRFLRRIHMHCLRENRSILHIAQARHAGATLCDLSHANIGPVNFLRSSNQFVRLGSTLHRYI